MIPFPSKKHGIPWAKFVNFLPKNRPGIQVPVACSNKWMKPSSSSPALESSENVIWKKMGKFQQIPTVWT